MRRGNYNWMPHLSYLMNKLEPSQLKCKGSPIALSWQTATEFLRLSAGGGRLEFVPTTNIAWLIEGYFSTLTLYTKFSDSFLPCLSNGQLTSLVLPSYRPMCEIANAACEQLFASAYVIAYLVRKSAWPSNYHIIHKKRELMFFPFFHPKPSSKPDDIWSESHEAPRYYSDLFLPLPNQKMRVKMLTHYGLRLYKVMLSSVRVQIPPSGVTF